MGGCCCHESDCKDDDHEEKCGIVNEEHPLSPKEYGTLPIATEKKESFYKEPLTPDPDSTGSNEGKAMLPGGTVTGTDISKTENASQENLTHIHSANCVTVDEEESQNDVSESTSMDKEIDQLVEAAMAAEVIYPPPANPDIEPSVPKSPSKTALHKQVSSKTSQESRNQDSGSDPEEDNAQDVSPTGPVSYKRKAFPRAKARAITMLPTSSRSNSDRPSIHDRGTSPKRKGFLPGERMKSHYAKDRVAKIEVERDIKEKLASHRAANDPRKAALERGERLGKLDDTIDEMKEHSSSFAQVARQLRDEQRGRTSTFPW